MCSARHRDCRPSCSQVVRRALLHAAHQATAVLLPLQWLWSLMTRFPVILLLPQGLLQETPPGTAPRGRTLPANRRGQMTLSWQARQLPPDTLLLRALQPELLNQTPLLRLVVRLLQCEP